MKQTVVFLDLETAGLAPTHPDIQIACVAVRAPAHQAGEGSGEAPARALQFQAVLIAVGEIAGDPNNPRRRGASEAEDADLVESVRQLGVLQPVLARPAPEGGYTLVFGHRRLSAALAAGLERIPAVIREMNDVEVLEAQLVENAARAGVHPLDEGFAYTRLAEMGRSVEEIAAKVGRSRATVYARMKLCELAPKVREALFTEKIETSVALLLARIPSKELQEKALKRVTPYHADDGPVSYRSAARTVHEEFMRALKGAPFDSSDASLVPRAGACGACPKRTGNQAELFGDVKSSDVCTDPKCYGEKAEAGWKRRATQARELGRKVLEGKAAEQASYSREYVKLDESDWHDAKQRTYRQILGATLKTADGAAKVVLARTEDRDGEARVLELYPAKALPKPKGEENRYNARTGLTTAQERKRLAEKRIEARVIEGLVAKSDRISQDWRWVARAVIEGAWHDTLKGVVARRDIEREKQKQGSEPPEETLLRFVAEADDATCQGVVVEILAAKSLNSLQPRQRGASEYRNQGAALACKLVGIDLAKLRKQVAVEIASEQKAKAEKAKTRARKDASKARPGE